MNETKKTMLKASSKRSRGFRLPKFLLPTAAACVLVTGIAGCSKDPREAVEDALEKTLASSSFEKAIGMNEINEALTGNTSHSSGITASVQKVSSPLLGAEYTELIEGFGITLDSAVDASKEQCSGKLGITYGDTTYLSAGAALDGSKLYLMVPQLLSGSLSVDFSTLGQDISSSALFADAFAQSGLSVPADLSLNLWEEFSASPTELPQSVLDACNNLDKQIVVEKVKKTDISLPEEIAAKDVYTLTIPKEAYTEVVVAFLAYIQEDLLAVQENLLSSIAENPALGGSISMDVDTLTPEAMEDYAEDIADMVGDIVLTVSVNKKGYANYISTDLEIEEVKIGFAVSYLGEKLPADDTQIKVTVKADDTKVTFTCSQNFDPEANKLTFSGKLSADDFKATFSGEGEYSNIEKGKKYSFDLNFFDFDCENLLSFTLAGSSYVDTTSAEITVPSGTEYELFKMDDTDLMNFVTELMTNLQSDPLLSEFLGLFSGLN